MYLYSNEIVFRGHPDKICDQISDYILTSILSVDPKARCGIETVGGKSKIFITGEVTCNEEAKEKILNNLEHIIKLMLQEEFNRNTYDNYEIINNIGIQSRDIAQGVDTGGAGDQGMMFGYACNETDTYLPKAQVILQELAKWYDEQAQCDLFCFEPDGKAQITGIYDEDFEIQKIKTFTISYQHKKDKRSDQKIINKATQIANKYGLEVEEFLINPTGKFEIGGFDADAGLTGRKIVVDNYHSFANVGGGAFSGKDPTKVDRSGAYKARQIAIRYLKKYNLKWCEVQLSYAIGRAEPLAIYITSDKGRFIPKPELYVECCPQIIIKDLNLLNTDYFKTAQYGHFGNPEFSWER